jgi:hypothetical protein
VFFEKFNNDTHKDFYTIEGVGGSKYGQLPSYAKYQRAYIGTKRGIKNFPYVFLLDRYIIGDKAHSMLSDKQKHYLSHAWK